MGGSSSKITLGRVYVPLIVLRDNHSDPIDQLVNRYGVKRDTVQIGPDIIQVEVELPDSYEKRRQAWIDAFDKVGADEKIHVIEIEIDCRFHQNIGQIETYRQALEEFKKVDRYNMHSLVDIHFTNVSEQQYGDLAKFINHFNNSKREKGTQFSFKISHLYVKLD